ncbi:MAG: hypothetical protein JO031_16760, partial [Ktedonobacteraceae bacterium]|nr:hypothetical protein [Ktedonobacteraceae bacterium]
MSIDELSNNRHEAKRDLITSANAGNGSLSRNYPATRNQGIATVSEHSGVKPSLSSQELKALHRMRVNRLIMRKRRMARLSKDAAPRIVTTAIIVFAVLILLVSGSTGAGYAY